jgi:hypothetical protein
MQPRRQYFRELLIRERRLTMPEILPTHSVESIARVCRQDFFMSPCDADNAARFAVTLDTPTIADLDALDSMQRRTN